MSVATPEDVDYAQCQDQLNQDLLKEHLLVERVIGQPHQGAGHRPATPLPQDLLHVYTYVWWCHHV